MSNKIKSLSPGLLLAYYREQPDSVKENIRKALGAFVTVKLNSSTDYKPQTTPIP